MINLTFDNDVKKFCLNCKEIHFVEWKQKFFGFGKEQLICSNCGKEFIESIYGLDKDLKNIDLKMFYF
jgi:hypothetical protein